MLGMMLREWDGAVNVACFYRFISVAVVCDKLLEAWKYMERFANKNTAHNTSLPVLTVLQCFQW